MKTLTAGRTIVYSMLAALTVAVLLFPSGREWDEPPQDPALQHLARTGARYRLQRELFRRAHSRMIARAAVAASPQSELVSIVRPSNVPYAAEELFRVSAPRRLASLPRRDSTMRVVVALTLDTGITIAGAPIGRERGSTDTFVPGSVAANACVVVVRIHDANPMEARRWRDYARDYWADGCWWYAAYGVPGRGVAAWLDSTRYGAIRARARPMSWLDDPDARNWTMDWHRGGSDQSLAACVGGRRSACPELMLRPARYRWGSEFDPVRTPGWIGAGRSWSESNESNSLAAALLQRFASEVGPEGFAAFWKSDQPFPEAFKAARGEPMDVWIARQFSGVTRVYHAGPVPVPTVLVGALATLVALLALGIAAVRRKQGFA